MKTILTLLVVLFAMNGRANMVVVDPCTALLHSWTDHTLYLIRNTPGYSPPVAARTLYYLSVANYESLQSHTVSLKSVDGQLNGYHRPQLDENQKAWEHITNELNYQLIRYYFVNMSPRDSVLTKRQYEELKQGYAKRFSSKELRAAETYATTLFKTIVNWGEEDGAKEAWNRNFPKTYVPAVCDSCWESTLPGYERALQPYWGDNRLAIASNEEIADDIPYVPFSTDSASAYFQQIQLVLNCYDTLTNEKVVIAKYWNDAPGVSGTPVGHLFAIARSLAVSEKLSLEKSLELYLLLGTAVNDAVIECWELKYGFNAIRPITYIHRYLQKPFVPILITPPFPEFPSGHSFQAGAAQAVFEHIFGTDLQFTDETNSGRSDINGAPRSYASFAEMAEEMSVSRFYGGIHYVSTLRQSLIYGRKVGVNTMQQLQLSEAP